MTYLIIGAPIGMKMTLQIMLAVLFMLPVIIGVSYLLGDSLFKKFDFIQERLEKIKEQAFSQESIDSSIVEIGAINDHINFVSDKMETLIGDLTRKNSYLANLLLSVAHDIKTPIMIINGYVEEVQDGLIDKEKLPEVLHLIKEEVRFLDSLSVETLEFLASQKEAHLYAKKESVHVRRFVEEEVFPLLPKQKDVHYLNQVEEACHISFHPSDLKKIMTNILFNALKYTKEGYICIENEGESLRFKNSGEAIDDQYKEKIFEPFFTVSKSRNRKEGGFGLGLSIVRNISLHNGYECFLEKSDVQETVFCLRPIKG